MRLRTEIRSDSYPKVVQSNRSGPQREPHLRLTVTLLDSASRSATLPALPHKAVSENVVGRSANPTTRRSSRCNPLPADVPNHPHVTGSERDEYTTRRTPNLLPRNISFSPLVPGRTTVPNSIDALVRPTETVSLPGRNESKPESKSGPSLSPN